MPHISIKMISGRTDAQKELAAQKVAEALREVLGCPDKYLSVAIEDFTPQEWQDVFAEEIADNKNVLKKPQYDPKELL